MTAKIIKSMFFYCISAFGVSLSIKAAIGVSPFNSMNLALSSATGIKIGTITFMINMLFLLGYMILTGFSHPSKYVIKGVAVFLFGSFINFFVYFVFKDLNITHYYYRVLLIIAGTVISGTAVGIIIIYDVITFPVESFCVTLSEKTNIAFLYTRYGVDLISLIISVSMSYFLDFPFYIREGTLISLLLFTSTINLSKNFFLKKTAPLYTDKPY